MPYRLACAKLMPGCDFKVEAATEEELLQKAAAHAAQDHGIKEITPELVNKVKSIMSVSESEEPETPKSARHHPGKYGTPGGLCRVSGPSG